MKLSAILAAFCLLACSACYAQAPEIDLDYPAEVTVRDLLCFDASGSVGDHFAWEVHYVDRHSLPRNERAIESAVRLLVGEGYTVTGPTGAKAKDYRIFESGRVLCAPSVPGRSYIVFLAVGNSDGLQSTLARTFVKPIDDPPDDPDDPDDPDPPDDPGPPTDLDLSAEARQWLDTVPQSARGPQASLAKTFVEIGRRGGEIGSIQTIDALLSVGVGASMGNHLSDWSAFLRQANQALEALAAKGVTPAQYGKAVESIGRGLE